MYVTKYSHTSVDPTDGKKLAERGNQIQTQMQRQTQSLVTTGRFISKTFLDTSPYQSCVLTRKLGSCIKATEASEQLSLKGTENVKN